MTKERHKNNSKIRNKFVRMLLMISIIFTAIVLALSFYIKSSNDTFLKERKASSDKVELVSNMEENFNDIFFRARGLYAFKNEQELRLMYEDFKNFEHYLNKFSKLKLTNDEMELYKKLTTFLSLYRNSLLPDTLSYKDIKDYKVLIKLSDDEANEIRNNLTAYSKSLKQQNELDLMDLFNRIVEHMKLIVFLYILLGLIVLIFIRIIMSMVFKNLIEPIEKLTAATDSFTTDQFVDIRELTEKRDEIGILANSLKKMTLSIKENEDILKTQNEELIAQQHELQENQIQLQLTLSQMHNELNHVLTFTLDKQQLLEDLHNYIREIFQFDASLLYLLDDDVHVSKGLTVEKVALLQKNLEPDKQARLQEEKTFVIKREITPNFETIASQKYYEYDMYSCILNSDGNLVAIMMATREGHPLTKQNISDMNGLMNQASVAFERIFMYEEVERARKLNQNIIDTVNEGIHYVSKTGKILLLNKAMFDIISYPNMKPFADSSQQEWLDYFQQITVQPEKLTYFLKNAIIEDFRDTKTLRYSIKRDTPIFIEVYATSVYEGNEKIGTMFVHRDITHEYEVDQMKSELVSTVSHELRTPLSSILGFTELLFTKELNAERQQKYFETIHKEAKRLTNLINDFLDIQRMESGKQVYTMKKLSMTQLVAEVVKTFQSEKKHKVHIIDKTTYVEISGDCERLMQLMINLIGNAIKFSPNGGDISIVLENIEDQIQVQIQDQGIGIAANEIPQLFQKFKRVDNSARRKIGGTGLGLALCKEIINKHNGSIWIESEEGKGTTVFFTLPLYMNDSLNNLNITNSKNMQSGLNILIVEEDLSLALLLSEELKSKGFTIIYHDNPVHAFKEAQQTPLLGIIIDLIFGDEVKGWDLVHSLKTTEKTKDIPIIITSALDESKENITKYHIEKYFTKPYNPEQLTEIFEQVAMNKR